MKPTQLYIKGSLTDKMITIARNCPECHKEQSVLITEEQLQDWQQGTLIQKAMPHLTPDQREMFLSGLCDDCFPN